MQIFLLNPDCSEEPALVDAEVGRTWSYKELRTAIARVANSLSLRQKSLVFCLCKNDLASVIGYLASVSSGNTACLIDGSMGQISQQLLIDHYEPDVILESASPSKSWSHYTRQKSPFVGLLYWRRLNGITQPIHGSVDLLLSTSGTIGSPKLVRLSQESVRANAESICESLEITENERALSILPIHYSYGLSVINSHLLRGGSVVLQGWGIVRPECWRAARAYT